MGKAADSTVRVFVMDAAFLRLQRFSLAASVVFFLCFLMLPFFGVRAGDDPADIFWMSATGCLLFGACVLISYRALKAAAFSDIKADEEGLWLSHRPRVQALVRWESIANTLERSVLQCLELCDARGETLIRLEYQLVGFEALREEVAKRMSVKFRSLPLPATFSKHWFYHGVHLLMLVGIAALGGYLGTHGNPLLGYGGCGFVVVVVLSEYLKVIHKVMLIGDLFWVHYPMRRVSYRCADLESVELVDSFGHGARAPEVRVWVKRNRQPLKLRKLGSPATELTVALRKWIELKGDLVVGD